MANNTTTISAEIIAAGCEVSDLALSTAVAAVSILLLCVIRFFTNKDIKWTASLLAIPFFMLIANHFYILYINSIAVSIGYGQPLSLYLPVSASFFVWVISRLDKYILGALVIIGIVAYFVSRLSIDYSISSYVICVLVVLAFFQIPSIKAVVHQLIMAMVMITTFVVLFLGIVTPDPEACGHPRNKLVLCTPSCGTITTNYTFSAEATGLSIGTVIVALLIVVASAWCKPTKRTRNNNQEGVDLDPRLHRGSGAWRPITNIAN